MISPVCVGPEAVGSLDMVGHFVFRTTVELNLKKECTLFLYSAEALVFDKTID